MFLNYNTPYRILCPLAVYALALFSLSGCGAEDTPALKRLPGERAPLEQPLPVADGATTDTITSGPVAMPVSAATDLKVGGNVLQVAGLAFTTGDDWKSQTPSSGMRAAQFEIPGEAGPAEAVVFFFGANQGGGLEDNVRRWAGQFTTEGTTTTPAAEVARIEKDELRLALVKTNGTYNPGMMGAPGVDTTPKPGFGLFGLVVEGGPQGTVFVKVTGPKATIDARNEELEKFSGSVRLSRYK